MADAAAHHGHALQRWKFKHPRPDDFFAVANEVAGRDLGWFFDQVYRGSDVFDYGVQELQSARDGDRYRTDVVVRRYGEAIFPVQVYVIFKNGERVTEQWDGTDRWKLYTYERPVAGVVGAGGSEPRAAPRRELHEQLQTLEPRGGAAATKWSLAWMVWLQDCLLSWAVLV